MLFYLALVVKVRKSGRNLEPVVACTQSTYSDGQLAAGLSKLSAKLQLHQNSCVLTRTFETSPMPIEHQPYAY